jgi:hypothetical protein
MNKHILFLIDHLANPDKYTQEELEDAHYAAAYRASETTYWVDEYFKYTGEDKQNYIDKLKG